MPASFFQMLEGALSYRPKSRSTAGELIQGEFAQFHIHHDETETVPSDDDEDDGLVESADDALPRRSVARTKSVLLDGAVGRHSSFLGYQRFERSVTTLLATLLPKDQCKELVTTLRSRHQRHSEENRETVTTQPTQSSNASKLQVIPLQELVKVVEGMNTKESIER